MKVLAPAKINLHLSVGPRRADGYHEIASIMQAVTLYDSLSFSPMEAGLSFDVSPAGSVPEDESNLVVRAVRALWGATGVSAGVAISLTKEIPVAAGLAGGSTDAGATLVGLKELWDLGISRKALGKIGAAIGSDVPFCVRGGTCVSRGRGEILSPLPVRSPLWWVVVVPSGSLSTAAVYDAVSADAVEEPAELAGALARGDVLRIGELLRNDLFDAAVSLMPSLAGVGTLLLDAGAVGAVMSGSGPSWIGLCRDEDHARAVAAKLAGAFPFVEVATSLEHGPRIVER